jgi:predicted nucleotidyltransferase
MNSQSPHVSERRRHRDRPRGPSPAVAEPRRPLLLAVLSFVRAAGVCPGVQRVSLLGSLATAKAIPKDVDLLVTIDGAMELTELARISRQLMGLRKPSIWAPTSFSLTRLGATWVASAAIGSVIRAFDALPSIAGKRTTLTTICMSSRYPRN